MEKTALGKKEVNLGQKNSSTYDWALCVTFEHPRTSFYPSFKKLRNRLSFSVKICLLKWPFLSNSCLNFVFHLLKQSSSKVVLDICPLRNIFPHIGVRSKNVGGFMMVNVIALKLNGHTYISFQLSRFRAPPTFFLPTKLSTNIFLISLHISHSKDKNYS